MDADGLVTRRRDTANRRMHVVELTAAGEDVFLRLRAAAAAFDRRLRAGIDDRDLTAFAAMLDRLAGNVTAARSGPLSGPPEPSESYD